MENTDNPLEKLQTPDLNKERLETLKKLFPDLFTNEGQLNINELKKVVDPQSVGETERYEFRWFGKSAAKRNAFSPSNATLLFDKKRSVNPTESENLIIEGENLEVLKLLTSAYREKVKCIYIDPPYNTGKDFVYSDNYSHFISIDDNEVHHLRKLCDEVFGEENFVGQLIWKSRQNKDNRTTTGVSTDHEYVICYSKNPEYRALRGSERKEEQYTNPDNDPRGPWVSGNMVGLKDENQRPNLHYDLINPETGINYGKPFMGWRYDQNTMKNLIEEERILWPDNPSGRPRRKVFLSELSDTLPGFSSTNS
jgi:adenine-specific DNA-methyltransferase